MHISGPEPEWPVTLSDKNIPPLQEQNKEYRVAHYKRSVPLAAASALRGKRQIQIQNDPPSWTKTLPNQLNLPSDRLRRVANAHERLKQTPLSQRDPLVYPGSETNKRRQRELLKRTAQNASIFSDYQSAAQKMKRTTGIDHNSVYPNVQTGQHHKTNQELFNKTLHGRGNFPDSTLYTDTGGISLLGQLTSFANPATWIQELRNLREQFNQVQRNIMENAPDGGPLEEQVNLRDDINQAAAGLDGVIPGVELRDNRAPADRQPVLPQWEPRLHEFQPANMELQVQQAQKKIKQIYGPQRNPELPAPVVRQEFNFVPEIMDDTIQNFVNMVGGGDEQQQQMAVEQLNNKLGDGAFQMLLRRIRNNNYYQDMEMELRGNPDLIERFTNAKGELVTRNNINTAIKNIIQSIVILISRGDYDQIKFLGLPRVFQRVTEQINVWYDRIILRQDEEGNQYQIEEEFDPNAPIPFDPHHKVEDRSRGLPPDDPNRGDQTLGLTQPQIDAKIDQIGEMITNGVQQIAQYEDMINPDDLPPDQNPLAGQQNPEHNMMIANGVQKIIMGHIYQQFLNQIGQQTLSPFMDYVNTQLKRGGRGERGGNENQNDTLAILREAVTQPAFFVPLATETSKSMYYDGLGIRQIRGPGEYDQLLEEIKQMTKTTIFRRVGMLGEGNLEQNLTTNIRTMVDLVRQQNEPQRYRQYPIPDGKLASVLTGMLRKLSFDAANNIEVTAERDARIDANKYQLENEHITGNRGGIRALTRLVQEGNPDLYGLPQDPQQPRDEDLPPVDELGQPPDAPPLPENIRRRRGGGNQPPREPPQPPQDPNPPVEEEEEKKRDDQQNQARNFNQRTKLENTQRNIEQLIQRINDYNARYPAGELGQLQTLIGLFGIFEVILQQAKTLASSLQTNNFTVETQQQLIQMYKNNAQLNAALRTLFNEERIEQMLQYANQIENVVTQQYQSINQFAEDIDTIPQIFRNQIDSANQKIQQGNFAENDILRFGNQFSVTVERLMGRSYQKIRNIIQAQRQQEQR